MVTIRDAFPGFSVDDIGAAREFYGTKLGLPVDDDAMGALRVTLPSGDADLVAIIDTPNGDNAAKFALALSAQGNVRTRTARAWPQSEFQKLISELP